MIKVDLIPYTNFYNPKLKLKVMPFSTFKTLAKNVMYKPHRLDFYGIISIEKGAGKHQIGEKTYEVSEGDVILLRPGQLHSFVEGYADFDAKILSFSDDFFVSTLQTDVLNENYEILTNFTEHAVLRSTEANWKIQLSILESIELELNSDYSTSQSTILQHLLSSFLHVLNRVTLKSEKEDAKSSSEWEKRIAINFKMLLRTGVYKHYTIKQYLDMLGVSQSTLQLATKKTFSKTPKYLLDEVIVFESKRMLMVPKKRIQEISFELGFSEPTNFSKFFKKRTGMTPEAYRKGKFF